MAAIKTILGFCIAIALIAFSVQNRDLIDIQYSPLHASFTLPIYAIGLGGLLIGFILGGTLVWINDGHLRREKRHQKKHIKSLEKDLETLNTPELKDTKNAPASDLFPTLPKK